MEQKLRRDCNMGANLRKLRLEHNISQEKLCAELQRNGCDIGRSTYEKTKLVNSISALAFLLNFVKFIIAAMMISSMGLKKIKFMCFMPLVLEWRF